MKANESNFAFIYLLLFLRNSLRGCIGNERERRSGWKPALSALRLQRLVEPPIDPPRVAFVDLVAVLGTEIASRIDVALGVVIVMAGLRIDSPHRADHLAREQDVVDRNHLGQEIDARLMIHAGVEEDVLEELLREQRLLQFLREPAIAAPMIGRGAAAMRTDEAQGREILEQVALDELHDRQIGRAS